MLGEGCKSEGVDEDSRDSKRMDSDDTRGKLSDGCSTKLSLLAEAMKSDRTRLPSTGLVVTSLLAEAMRSDRTRLLSTGLVMTSLLVWNNETGDELSTEKVV